MKTEIKRTAAQQKKGREEPQGRILRSSGNPNRHHSQDETQTKEGNPAALTLGAGGSGEVDRAILQNSSQREHVMSAWEKRYTSLLFLLKS